jgi:hypothetical protein
MDSTKRERENETEDGQERKRIRLSLESFEDKRVESIDVNGEEVPVKVLSDEERFASLIQLFRFPIQMTPYSDYTIDDPLDKNAPQYVLPLCN